MSSARDVPVIDAAAPDLSSDEIVFDVDGGLGRILLNRPDQLNALTHAMALRISAQLTRWATDDRVKAVAISGAGERGFCAGGDIRRLYEQARDPDPAARAALERFFWDEYRLNAQIKSYAKPYIAFMDGVVMGGGVGVSIHGRYRVGGDRTAFAMPECGIGFIPDVGASYFLPRLPRRLGWFAGLTGARFDVADCIFGHVVDYYVRSAQTEATLAALAAADYEDDADEAVCEVLALNGAPPPTSALKAHAAEIEELFAVEEPQALLAGLEQGSDWAKGQAAALKAKAPFSVALTLRMLGAGAGLDLPGALALEYRLALATTRRPDFAEGVRAAVIDKDGAPRWAPSELGAVDPAEIEAALASLGAGELALA